MNQRPAVHYAKNSMYTLVMGSFNFSTKVATLDFFWFLAENFSSAHDEKYDFNASCCLRILSVHFISESQRVLLCFKIFWFQHCRILDSPSRVPSSQNFGQSDSRDLQLPVPHLVTIDLLPLPDE